jgi:exonuclease SbcC
MKEEIKETQVKREEEMEPRLVMLKDNRKRIQKYLQKFIQEKEEKREISQELDRELYRSLHEKEEEKQEEILNALLEIGKSQRENQENIKKVIQEKEESEDRKKKTEEEMIITLHEKEEKSQREIMDILLEFKFEYLENVEKAKKPDEEREDPIDIRDEFRAIHSENLMTVKRIMTDCHMEVVQPLITIQEGIERNLNEIPENTRNIIRKVTTVEKELKEKEEKEKEKMNTITMLGIPNLVQTNEGREEIGEIRTDIDELKLSIRELELRVIEFGSTQEERDTENEEKLREG